MTDIIRNTTSAPLVSVVVPTYQHAAFIERCIQGILMQQTTFPVEILVGEDESTDGTRAICQRYAAALPDRVRLFLRSRQDVLRIMGRPTGRANLLHLLGQAKGKYIALCEGDDYWTDPLKLQKQVDHLERHPEDVLCFHAVGVVEPGGRITEDKITQVPAAYATQADLALRGNYIHTPSVIFRNILHELPPEIKQTPIADFFLWTMLSGHGNLHYLPEVMAHYRMGGTWSSLDRYRRVLNTAYCHAAIHAWAKRTGNAVLPPIFLRRIERALEEQREHLTASDLARFRAFAPEVRRVAAAARRRLLYGKPLRAMEQLARKAYRRIKPRPA